jgi:uncharacterized protein YjcR
MSGELIALRNRIAELEIEIARADEAAIDRFETSRDRIKALYSKILIYKIENEILKEEIDKQDAIIDRMLRDA